MLPKWFEDQWKEERDEAKTFRTEMSDRLSAVEDYIVAEKAVEAATVKREKTLFAALGIVVAIAAVVLPFVVH